MYLPVSVQLCLHVCLCGGLVYLWRRPRADNQESSLLFTLFSESGSPELNAELSNASQLAHGDPISGF